MHGFISNVAPSSEEPTRPPAVHSQQAIGAIADAWLANTQGDDQVLNGPSLPPLPSPQVNAESALSPISVPIESSPTPPPSTETYLQVQTVDIIQEPTVAFSEPEIADEYLNPITSSELLPEHNLSLNETTNSDVSAQTDSVPTICRLCGDSGLDSTQVVTLDGNEVTCDIFDLIFRSANIFDGSDRCSDYRGEYFSTCCGTTSVDDGQSSVGKCILCGDSAPREDVDAIIFFSGEVIYCTDLATKLLEEEDGISSDSAICQTSKNSYSEICCIQDPGTSSGEMFTSSAFSPATPEAFPEYWTAISSSNHASTTTISLCSSLTVLVGLLWID
jgi:hypothetical protein